MNKRIVVTGTDTGVGKTVFSAGLAGLLGANYWKPVQAGLEQETDSECVRRLGGLSSDRIVPELYRLRTACVAALLRGDRRHSHRYREASTA
ncbi:dethiobiotin synthetase [Bradyrhizobium sp. USDA 4459]